MGRTLRVILVFAGALALSAIVWLPLLTQREFSVGMYFSPGLLAWLVFGLIVALVAFFWAEGRT